EVIDVVHVLAGVDRRLDQKAEPGQRDRGQGELRGDRSHPDLQPVAMRLHSRVRRRRAALCFAAVTRRDVLEQPAAVVERPIVMRVALVVFVIAGCSHPSPRRFTPTSWTPDDNDVASPSNRVDPPTLPVGFLLDGLAPPLTRAPGMTPTFALVP